MQAFLTCARVQHLGKFSKTGGGARPTRLHTAGAFNVGGVSNALRTGRDSKWDPDLPVTVFNEAFLI